MRRPADDAQRDRKAKGRVAACLPARRCGAAAGYSPMTAVRPASVVVIGTGLIGTSVALALREQDVGVWLSDRDAEAVRPGPGIRARQPPPPRGAAGRPGPRPRLP